MVTDSVRAYSKAAATPPPPPQCFAADAANPAEHSEIPRINNAAMQHLQVSRAPNPLTERAR